MYGGIFINLADFYFERKNYIQALAHLKVAEKLFPFLPRLKNRIGIALYECRRFDEAISYFKHALPSSIRKEAFHNIGRVYFTQGNIKKAAALFQKALLIDRNYSKSLLGLALCYKQMGENQKAKKLLIHCISVASPNSKELKNAKDILTQLYHSHKTPNS